MACRAGPAVAGKQQPLRPQGLSCAEFSVRRQRIPIHRVVTVAANFHGGTGIRRSAICSPAGLHRRHSRAAANGAYSFAAVHTGVRRRMAIEVVQLGIHGGRRDHAFEIQRDRGRLWY